MKKNQVTEGMHLEREWFEKARKCTSLEMFNEFYKELFTEINHDYGTVCHAVGALALAAANLGASVEGITGFQAGFVMWDFIRQWEFPSNKSGINIIDYDDMLYPQYKSKFDKVISTHTWDSLRKEAERLLYELGCNCCESVRKHWQSIVDGQVPFGYTVSDKEDKEQNPRYGDSRFGIMKAWVARNSDGSLYLFSDNKPTKGTFYWFNYGNFGSLTITEQDLPEGVNPQWSDDEPIEVELKIRKEATNEAK